MSEVRIRENESLESALKRFKRQCARSGVLQEVRVNASIMKSPALNVRKKLKPPVSANGDVAKLPSLRRRVFLLPFFASAHGNKSSLSLVIQDFFCYNTK